MALLQYVRERKKLLLLIVIYVIAFHIIYNRYWKGNTGVTHTGVHSVFESIWNFRSSAANETDNVDENKKTRKLSNHTENAVLGHEGKVSVGNHSKPSGQVGVLLPLANATEAAASTGESVKFDIHLEHPVLGHTGEVTAGDDSLHVAQFNATTIAIGGGITSKGVQGVNANNIAAKFQLFYTFLPTFCRTASPGYQYRFYFAYDYSDPVFTDASLLAAFQITFAAEMRRLCHEPRKIQASIHMVQCSHTGKPTWAQNDAMLEAYLDHVDYYYRVNDDTRMDTVGWVEAFIDVLNQYKPPYVGVVGPNHSGGNVAILTYDFVHRTHVDIFGFYYPRLFTDWWGDDWVTIVYRPDRSTKLTKIRLAHTLGLGQRYKVDFSVSKKLQVQLQHDKITLQRYVQAVNNNGESGVKPDGRKVISMSLYGKDPRYTWGVLRNAQLVPVYLPDWTLRVYVAAAPSELAVPQRILHKLRLLGAEIAQVGVGNDKIAPRNWRLLVANDEHVDYFLVRDADTRLSDREAVAVRDWVSTAEKNGSQSGIVHCVRDHPKHADQAIVDGLWGGRPRALHERLKWWLTDFEGLAVASKTDMNITLKRLVWPAVAKVAYCHDSVSPCDHWSPSSRQRPFPSSRHGKEYLGQKFDEHQELVSTDGIELNVDACN